MKILYIIPTLSVGGAEKYVVKLSNSLVNKGYSVAICTIGSGGILKRELDKRVSVYELGKKTNLTINKVLLLKKIIEKGKFDILHSHLFKADLLNYFNSLSSSILVNRYTTEHSTSSRRKKYKVFGFIQKVIYKRFESIIAISDIVYKHINLWSGTNKDKVVLIYNGTDIEIKSEDDIENKMNSGKNEKYEIGSIARLESRKDLATTLNAIGYLTKRLEFNNFNYTVYGDGPEKDRLMKLTKELDIEKYVTFAGFHPQIELVIDRLDIHIISSKEEGFGISIIETMARGIPNIGTNTGGIPEVISDNIDGLLVNVGEYEELARKIFLLLNNKKLLSEFAFASQRKVKRFFLLENNMVKLLEVYKKGYLRNI